MNRTSNRIAAVALLCSLHWAAPSPADEKLATAFPAGAGSMLEAQSAYSRGDYERAAALLQELVSREGQNAVAWLRLGRALSQRGAYEDAWRAYDRAIELTTPWSDDRDARAIELEARKARASIAIDAGLEDLATARALSTEASTTNELRDLENQLTLARSGRAAITPWPTKPVRAKGRVIQSSGSPSATVQVIEGNTQPAPAKPSPSVSKQ
jgi:tetratricopeptide (TPR) repeat protein